MAHSRCGAAAEGSVLGPLLSLPSHSPSPSPDPPLRSSLQRHAWRLGIGVALGLAVLALALRGIDLDALAQAVVHARPGWVGLALASVLLNTALKVVRWRLLLGPQAARATVGQLVRALMVGQMLNTLVPARAGDLARAWLLGREGVHPEPPERAFVLASVMLEKVVDLLAYSLCAIVLAFLVPLPAWLRGPAMAMGTLALVGLGGVVVLLFGQAQVRGLLTRLRARWRVSIESALDSLHVLRQRGRLGQLAGWTCLVWVTAWLNNYLLFFAFDLALPPTTALLLLVALQASVSVPGLPGGLGVFEALCVLSLGLYGVDRVAALSYGLTLHTLVLGPGLVLGGGLLVWGDGALCRRNGNMV
jgi:uncharacterized protein (TIRG00374 family)